MSCSTISMLRFIMTMMMVMIMMGRRGTNSKEGFLLKVVGGGVCHIPLHFLSKLSLEGVTLISENLGV